MKTHDLIELLAKDPYLKTTSSSTGEFKWPLMLGFSCSVVLLYAWKGLHPNLPELASSDFFWVKMIWLCLLAVGSIQTAWRLLIPGLKVGQAYVSMPLAYLFLGVVALSQWAQQPNPQAFWHGTGTGWLCISSILLLAIPFLVVTHCVFKGMAPTNPSLAGVALGIFSGASAAMVYSLLCHESSFGFYLLWYGAGLIVVTVFSLYLSRWTLRW